MLNNASMTVPAVSSAERDHLLYLARNSPPPNQLPQLVPTMPSIKLNAAAQIQIIDSEILSLKHKICVLEQRRTEWSMHLSCAQSLLAPIRSLPTELLQLIFENVILDDAFYYHPYANKTASHRSSVIRVSSLWRSVVLACPRFWTTIQSRYINETYLKDVVLPRTVQCGLEVSVIDTYGVIRANNLISHYSHRIQRLLLEGPLPTSHHGWANLTHLQLRRQNYRPCESFRVAPRLHTMTLESVNIPRFSFPWVQIRSLTIRWASLEDLQCVLPQATNLKLLTLEEYDGYEDLDSNEIVPIIVSAAHTLETIGLTSDHGPRIFSFLALPNLHTLRFKQCDYLFSPVVTAEFHAFQTRSQSRITVLSIIDMVVNADLVQVLSLIPTLQDLTIATASMPCIDDTFLDSLNAGRNFETVLFPKLKSLSLELMSISETLLLGAVLSRRHINSHVSCLEFLSVVVKDQVFDTAAIDPLVQLRHSGLRLVLQDRTSSRY